MAETYTALLKIAKAYANAFSDDPTTTVGAIIIDDNNQIVSMGTNHSPYVMKLDAKGENREKFETVYRNKNGKVIDKEKFKWVEHAERNAIFNALNHGTSSLKGYTLIATLAPCINCARAIISVGIRKVVTILPCPAAGSKWGTEFAETSEKLFIKAGVEVVKIGLRPDNLTINLEGLGWDKDNLGCYAIPAPNAPPKQGGYINLKRKRQTRKRNTH